MKNTYRLNPLQWFWPNPHERDLAFFPAGGYKPQGLKVQMAQSEIFMKKRRGHDLFMAISDRANGMAQILDRSGHPTSL